MGLLYFNPSCSDYFPHKPSLKANYTKEMGILIYERENQKNLLKFKADQDMPLLKTLKWEAEILQRSSGPGQLRLCSPSFSSSHPKQLAFPQKGQA